MVYLFVITLLVATMFASYFLGRLFGSLIMKFERKLNRVELHKKYGRKLEFFIGFLYTTSFVVYLSFNVIFLLYVMHLIKSILRSSV